MRFFEKSEKMNFAGFTVSACFVADSCDCLQHIVCFYGR